MSDLTFHPTLVEPFYLHFMNANVVHEPREKAEAVLGQFRATLPEYSTDLLRLMLAESWRPAKVAAWVIAAERRIELLPDLCERLISQPSHVEQFCIALARLRGPRAGKALLEYLVGCADGDLQRNHWDESVDPDWALASIEDIEPPESATRLAATDAWRRFLAGQDELMLTSFQQRLPRARETLNRTLGLLDGYFP